MSENTSLDGLRQFGLLIGLIYVIHFVICANFTTIKLQYYLEDKEATAADGLRFDSDKEGISILINTLTFDICGFLTSSLLIWGILKQKHLYFIPWLIMAFFLILQTGIEHLASVYQFMCHIVEPFNYPQINVNVEAIKILIFSTTLVVQILFHITIQKLYKELVFEHQTRIFETSSATYIYYLGCEDG
ncbi:uncharacterized protein LOC105262558 [Musca domestica]|uniref:Uncharacterized protein LOC105262558 n=1 Tax=Musca domestica TaxID=7370 RepID=A0A1I8NJZ9_MUSDO|nr:uncharacterized protein LOC105262558 [Musca domestica]